MKELVNGSNVRYDNSKLMMVRCCIVQMNPDAVNEREELGMNGTESLEQRALTRIDMKNLQSRSDNEQMPWRCYTNSSNSSLPSVCMGR
jgi:hypothetical protein